MSGGALKWPSAATDHVSSCAQYNDADASGQPVAGWDDPLATKLVRDRWGTHQKTKLAGLRAFLPGVRFAGNNLGSTFNVCNEDLLGNAYDGGVLEHWMKSDAAWSLDWGASELAVAGTGRYRRTYSNGTVFVNPGTASVTYALDGTYYDVVNKDLAGQPTAVTSVTIGPKDAAFLLGSAAVPEPPPDTTTTTPPSD